MPSIRQLNSGEVVRCILSAGEEALRVAVQTLQIGFLSVLGYKAYVLRVGLARTPVV
jgi:hypothetical protein